MIAALIRWSVAHRSIVLGATALLLGWGVFAIQRVPVDALPDLAENQVIVFADWPGRSPREVEDHVTQPLSIQLQGLGGVRSVRASSMFGFALVTVIFEDAVGSDLARARVLERLNSLAEPLPEGVVPRLGPHATALGWIYQYYLEDASGKQDLGSLRALQDNVVRRELAAVPGVGEVAGIGGFVRQWQVEISALRLKQHGLTLDEIVDAIARNNLSVGGGVLEENGMEFVVRGRGQTATVEDLESIPIAWRAGKPLRLGDVATVQLGGADRRGALDVDGREVVGGTVIMRTGENAPRVIADMKARIAQLGAALPAGVRLRSFYDRSELVERAIGTLRRTLFESVLLVTLVHVLFLFHFRSILIVTLPLPASILIAFVLMKELGIASHIMSLTGIAIAIGVLVDAAIVITENVLRRGAEEEARLGRPMTREENGRVALAAAQQVGRPIVFAMAIVILAFVPVFALGGQAGKLFHPLAWTKTFAMIGATLLAVTLVPVLCTLLARGPFHPEARNRPMRVLLALYDPALNWALRHRAAVLGLAGTLLAFCLVLAFGVPVSLREKFSAPSPRLSASLSGLGSEFMPALDEGALLFMPVLPPGTAQTEVRRILAWQDRVIRDTPEVADVVGKLGRFDTPTDPAPVEMIETTITLKPRAHWRDGMTKDKLVAELSARLAQVPGYVPGFLQPIEARALMLSTGTRADLALKLYGDDLAALQAKALEAAVVVEKIPGATGVVASRLQDRPYLEIEPDPAALARHGLSAEDVLAVIETGLGGKTAATTLHGRERRSIRVRFERADREEIDRIAALPVPLPPMSAPMPARGAPLRDMPASPVSTPQGRMHASRLAPSTPPATERPRIERRYIALGEVATVRRASGPSEIASENGRLVAFVQANVSGRDLGGFVEDVRRSIAQRVVLPPGMTLAYSGQFEHQLRAQETLHFIMPAVVLIAFLVLLLAFGSAREAAHLLLAVPFALTGGVLLQWSLGFPFSVAVWIGYIALFGTAIQTGVVMVTYLDEAVTRKRRERGADFSREDLLAAVTEGARGRLRPKVMTVATTIAGLLPIFWSTRVGADVMRPIAAPVVGGMLSSLVHILIVTPVIFLWLRERELKNGRV